MTLSAQASGPDTGAAQGMTIVARTQGQMIRRRFFRHRAALAGMILFGFVVVLSFSSIGFMGIPGWWDKSYLTTGALVNQGKPTLSVVPEFLGGSGIRLGEHPFGQDDIGVDYFAKTMRGTQQSIIVAFLVAIVATTVGTLVGAVSGYYRGKTEAVLMRFTDVMITIPVLVIAAVVGRRFGASGVVVLGIFIGLVIWPSMARLLRGEFLSLREKEFVEAARALGTSARRIIFRHILPNTVGVIIVSATLTVANAVLLESALSFLGLGVQAPDTSLGQLINEYRTAMVTRPWLFWWPGIFIIAIALSINFIGDGLRDAFDPRQTRVRA
ncbi:ABC transporter permease [Planobispora siamensis]|uniref:ABC transporter permease n=1 Tax=Planobispora siamensis TaxID=936338 RepID=A0A8J3S9K8_9ACTN|nr:ABC transporter permease [Planobispora siamensis]GIH90397.1 ABC transporter permease [Planobispora siamensis]